MKVPARLTKGTPCCYILRCANGSLYTGWTSDLARRVAQHSSGRGGRYTRSHRPVELVYAERQPDSSAARKREAQIKRLGRIQKDDLIAHPRRRKLPATTGPRKRRQPQKRSQP
jgi:putative endonuclease